MSFQPKPHVKLYRDLPGYNRLTMQEGYNLICTKWRKPTPAQARLLLALEKISNTAEIDPRGSTSIYVGEKRICGLDTVQAMVKRGLVYCCERNPSRWKATLLGRSVAKHVLRGVPRGDE